jgi:hypothetical protein
MHSSVLYLRAGCTTLCVTASVVVLVLWLRSLRQTELLYDNHFNGGATSVTSKAGTIQFNSYQISAHRGLHGSFDFKNSKWNVPYLVPLLILAVLGVLPWIRHLKRQFSLRTVLISMTLMAIILGLAVYATRPD